MEPLDQLIAALASNDPVAAYQAMQKLQSLCFKASAPDKASDRTGLAAALATEITAMTAARKDEKGNDVPAAPRHAVKTRMTLLRLLAIVGTDAEVPMLATLLSDLDLREPARAALDRNPSPQATAALIKAVDEVGPTFRIGVIGSLGDRPATAESAAALARIVRDEADPAVRVAAAEALARFPDPQSDKALSALAACDCPQLKAHAARIRLRLADTLERAGKSNQARRILDAVAASSPPPAQQKAMQAR